MEAKYLKALKAGLLCAALIILIQVITRFVFYQALNKPAVQDWVMNQSANSSYSGGLSGMPPDALMAGVAVCGAGLLVFAIYLLAGVLAAWFTAKIPTDIVDLLLLGAIAGYVAEAISGLFQLCLTLLLNMLSAGPGTLVSDITGWLPEALFSDLVVLGIVAAILGAIGSLIAGAMIKAFGRKNRT